MATLVGLLAVPLTTVEAARAAPVTMVTADAVPNGDLNALWRAYGDAGGHWTGGDRTISIELPDERIAWLFSDTFLGTVNADHSRPRSSPQVHNALVVQQADGQLGATLTGGTATSPTSLVEVAGSDLQYWVGDGHVAGDQLQVLYNTYRSTGAGVLDVEMTGTSLVTFSLPDLAVANIQALPLGDAIAWGSSVLDDGEYTYVYGSEDPDNNGVRFAHVARVGRGLGGSWEFFDGTSWSDAESDSARLFRGVGTAYDVVSVGDRYVLVTQDSNILFSYAFAAYTADSPTGPFTGPVYLFDAPREYPDGPVVVYDAHIHTAFSDSGHLTISYNVNSLDPNDNFSDARLYRPRFVTVDWPRPVPDPATLPGAPRDLRASNGDEGLVHLSWTPPAAGGEGVTYRVYQRDVTSGQDNFARYDVRRTETSADLWQLQVGHTYEFRVTAQNDVGEGTPSNTASLDVDFQPPPAPANLRAAPTGNAQVRLDWDATSGSVTYRVYQRNVSAQQTEFSLVPFPSSTQTTLTVGPLMPGDEYEFKVTANHGGGESPPSNLVRATPTCPAPPTPTGLAAASQANGDITLSWTAPAEGLWYRIWMRDITANEVDFTKIDIPAITNSWTATAAYLAQDHTYEFKVASTNQCGDSADTAPVRAPSHVDPAPEPTGLVATPQPDGTIALNWNSVGPNAWYSVWMRNATAHEDEFTKIDIPATTNSWLAQYLIQDNVYEFKVASLTRGGESAPTEPVRATARYPAPTTPTGLVAAAQPDGTIALSWDSAGPNAWYSVWMRNASRQEGFKKIEIPATTTSWLAQYLDHDNTYEFKVASLTQGGESPPTQPVQATAHYPIPPTPTGLVATAQPDGTIALAWNSVGPNAWYSVWMRNASANEGFTKIDVPAATNSWLAQYLIQDNIYEFKVASLTQGGESPPTEPVRATAHYPVPPTPTGLKATAQPDGTIALAWNSVGPNAWYSIWMRNVSKGESDFTKFSPVTTNSWLAQYLEHDNVYEFKVASLTQGGESPPTQPVRATAHYNPPAAPTNLTATPQPNSVRLQWTASPTAGAWYWVEYRNVDLGQGWQRHPVPLTGATVFNFAGLPGNNHEFRIRSNNAGGDSPPSNVVTARPLPPAPPTGLVATPRVAQIDLRWTASTTANVWYWVEYRDATIGQAWQRISTPVAGGTSFTMGYLKGDSYEFRVRSTAASGESVPSNVVAATPLPPAPPSGLTATAQPNQVYLRWNPSPTPNVWYWVEYRDADTNSDWQRHPVPVVGGTSFTMTGLWGHTYQFRIRSTGLSGESTPSNVVGAKPLPPLPPRNLTAVAGDMQVWLSWAASPTPNVLYWVEYRDASVGQGWQRLIYPTAATSALPGYLYDGHTYEFRVRAAGMSGESVPSNVVSARPLPPPPTAPDLTAYADPLHGVIRLEWYTYHTNGLYFWIQWEMPDGQWWTYPIPPIVAFPGNTFHWANIPVSQLWEFATYNFRVVAVNPAGEAASQVRVVKAWPSTGTMYYRFTTAGRDSQNYFFSAKGNRSWWNIYGFDWSDDGCSSPTGDAPSGVSFYFACARHDFGYRNHRLVGFNDSGWRGWVDYTLLDDMRNACYDVPWIIRPISCIPWAGIYYAAVRTFGGSHW